MPSRVIHVWKPLEAQTLCGLWFKGIPSTEKPNIVSESVVNTMLVRSVPGICKRCERTSDNNFFSSLKLKAQKEGRLK